MKYKALFTDFDGTLFSDNFTVSEKDIAAIKDYTARGGKFFISTGRLFNSIYPYLNDMGVESEMIVVSQGAEVYNVKTKEPLFRELISQDLAKRVFAYIDKYIEINPVVTAMMYIDDEVYFIDRLPEYREAFCNILKIKPHILDCTMLEYLQKVNKEPSKILVMLEENHIEEFIQGGIKDLNGEAVFCESRKFLIEIMPNGINKGTAVKFVADQYGIDMDDVICAGDSDNDLSMIQAAGLGVATANALDRVKKYANYIAPSCNDSPIANIIETFCKN
ncbi:MAG: Cof-type HAD-IIB family hydrolase [Clostridia bacterium]|nr:Cof-type HAD-IIB family hydrolase [Clostridia bacterium]